MSEIKLSSENEFFNSFSMSKSIEKYYQIVKHLERIKLTTGKYPPIIIDGNNVAYNSEKSPKYSNIHEMKNYLHSIYTGSLITVVSSALKSNIDEKNTFEKAINNGLIRRSPAGESDDYYALSLSKRYNGVIISNDLYREHKGPYETIKWRRIGYMICSYGEKTEVIIPFFDHYDLLKQVVEKEAIDSKK